MAQAQIQAGESEISYLLLRQLARDVRVRLSDPLELPSQASSTNLLAVSNQRGILAAATTQGFLVHPLSSVRNLFTSSERNSDPRLDSPAASIDTLQDPKLASRANFVRIANSETLILVGLENGRVAAWDIQSCLQGGRDPTFVIEPPSAGLRLIELSPNPSDRPELCVAIYAQSASTSTSTDSGTAIVLDVVSGKWGSQLQVDQESTAVCWSVKGKQIALGLANGEIVQITPEGEQKDRLPRPKSLDANNYVLDIKWLENHVFCVTYNQHSTSTSEPDDDPTHEENVFMILRDAKSSTPLTFVQYEIDPSPAFGDTARKSKRFSTWLKGWTPTKHLLFIGNSPSSDIGLIGLTEEDSNWKTLELEEISKPVLPFTKSQMETGPVGIELDLSSDEGVSDPGAAASGEDENTKLAPMPILLIYTTDGVLIAYHVINTTKDSVYPGMIRPSQRTNPTSNATTSATPISTPSKPASTQSSAVSTPAPNSTPFSFGTPSKISTSSPSAVPGFGQQSGFGQSSPFGSTAFGQTSAFGSQTAPKSAFGSTSSPSSGGFGAFGGSKTTGFGGASATAFSFGSPSNSNANASSSPSAFGTASAFGAAATPSSPSVFGGSSAFGQSPANQSQQEKPATPAFNTPASGSAFGGFASKSSGFGGGAGSTSIFGSSASNETFSSAFSSPSASAFGKPVKAGASSGAVISEKERRAEEDEKRAAESNTGFSFGNMNNMLGGTGETLESEEPQNKSQDMEESELTEDKDQQQKETEMNDDVEDEPERQGERGETTNSFSPPSSHPKPQATSAFSFGKPADTSKVGFGTAFGKSQSPPASGGASTPSFGFGGFGSAANASKTSSGASSPPGFSFGQTVGGSPNTFSFGKIDEKKEETPKATFSFGSQGEKKDESSDSRKSESGPATATFSFGGKENKSSPAPVAESNSQTSTIKSEEDEKSASSSPSATDSASLTSKVEEKGGTSRDNLASEAKEDSKSKSAFSFGDQNKTELKSDASLETQEDSNPQPKPAFSFGKSEEAKPKTTFSFGNQADAEKKPPLNFSFGPSKPAETKPDASSSQEKSTEKEEKPNVASNSLPTFSAPPSGGFSFGGVQPATIKSSSPSATQAIKGPSFAQAPAGGFSFGSSKVEGEDEDDEEEDDHHEDDGHEAEEENEDREESQGQTNSEEEYEEESEQEEAEEDREDTQDRVDETQEDAEEEDEDEDERSEGDEDRKRKRAAPKEVEQAAPSQAPKAQPFSFAPAPTSSSTSTPKFSFGPSAPSQGQPTKPSGFSFGSPFSSSPTNQPQSAPFTFNTNSSTAQSGSSSTPPSAAPTSISPSTTTSTSVPASNNTPKFSFGSSSENKNSQKGGFQNFNARVPRSSSPLTGAPVNRGDLEASPEKKEDESRKLSKPSAFSGFGKPSPPSQPSFASAPQGGFNFNTKQPSTFGSPSQSSQFKPKPQPQSQAQLNQPAGGFSFASKQSQPANLFSPTSSTPASPSMVPEVPPSASPLPPPVARAPLASRQPAVERERVTQSPFHDLQPPRLGSTVSAPDLSEIKETGMQGEFMRTYTIMERELKELHRNVLQCKTFQQDLQSRSDRPPESTSDFSDQALWTFADLERMVALARTLEAEVNRMNDESLEYRRKLNEIKSLGLKAEAKREEGERYIRALTDPVYANSIRTRELGPAHVENQMRLRKMRSAVKESLQALENHLGLVKRRIQEAKMGRTPMKVPTLDSIHRSIKNISASAGAKIFDLDELSSSYDLLARHSQGRSVTPSASVPRYETGLGAFNLSSISASLSFEGQAKQPPHRAVASALESKRAAADLGAAWTAAQRRPILNKNATREIKVDEQKAKTYEFSDLQMSFAKGPVKLQKKPSPIPTPQPRPADSSIPSHFPSAQASPSSVFASGFNAFPAPQPSMFGSSSQFNPAPASSSPSFSIPPSSGFFNPGGREKEGSASPTSNNRSSHTRSSRRATTAVPLPSSTAPTTPTPSFSFGTPPSFGDVSKRTSPAGSSFSFAGLQAPTPISSANSHSTSAKSAPTRSNGPVAGTASQEDQDYEDDFEEESDGEWDAEENEEEEEEEEEEGLSAVDEEEEEEEFDE